MSWSSDSEDEDDVQQEINTVSYLLIAIDSDKHMFIKNDKNEDTTFKVVLKTCYQIIDGQLMKGGKRGGSHIGIVIVSEDDDDERMSLCEFKDNIPSTLKKLRELCELSDEELENKFKRNDAIQLSQFLLRCKSKLNKLNKEYFKYLAYITNNENPVANDEDEKRLCINQAATFQNSGIRMELLTLNPFLDYAAFFGELLQAAECRFSYEYYVGSIDLQEKLLSMFHYRGQKALFFPFKDHQNYFEVIEKRYIKPHKILNNVRVTKDTNTEVKLVNKGGQTTNKYLANFSKNHEPIELTVDEREIILSDGMPVGFSLLGTYKGDMIETGYHSTDPKFIQNKKSKSCPHFDIFWQYCVDKDSKLICVRKYKKDGPSKLVELSPNLVNGVRSFLVLGIPYNDDIRFQPIHDPLHQDKPTDGKELKEAAENLVKALDFPYDPLKIHDTVNCRQWEYIRSELLDEKQREVPNIFELDVIQRDVEDVVENFKQLTPITGIKRKAATKGSRKK